MKTAFTFLFGIFIIMSFSNCANGRKITEKPPVAMQQVYYTPWAGGVKETESGYNLFIPVEARNEGVALDSVYFRGKGAELFTNPQHPDLYIAHFVTSSSSEEEPDFVMSSDPREEYGNRPPKISRHFPFELEDDEAVVSFQKNGKKSYYKITGIKKKNSDVKINYPDNIQH